jgi:hypothetical protein
VDIKRNKVMKKPIKKSSTSSKFDNLKGAGIRAKSASFPKSIKELEESGRKRARIVKRVAEDISDKKAFKKRMSDSGVDQMSPKKPDYAKLGRESKDIYINRRRTTSSGTALEAPKPIVAVAPRKKSPTEVAKNSPNVKYDGRTAGLRAKSRDKSASVRSRSKAAAKAEIRQTKLITRSVAKSSKEKAKAMVQGARTFQKVKSLTPEERKVYMNGPAPKVRKRDIPVTTSQVRKKRGGKF